MATLAVQLAAAAAILLLIFGPPTQLSTIIGLATAGLTVVLKDFIVAFFGWFVLMGRNGMRLGDWVEINGVSGEVIEIGLLQTVLLEMGNWRTPAIRPAGACRIHERFRDRRTLFQLLDRRPVALG